MPRDDKVVKRAIVPKLGALSYFDFSQIEPRLTAYFAAKIGHPEFAEKVRSGVDAYTAVAQLVTAKEEVTKAERQVWKRVFLAMLYGAGTKRVRETWIEETKEEISMSEAKRIIDTFHTNWPAVHALQAMVQAVEKKRGYIVSIGGRRLHAEEFGEHKLLNKLIQGSAADVMKQALINVHEFLVVERGLPVRSHMISVVHDEIQLDGPEDELTFLHDNVPALMDAFPAVSEIVPVTVDHEVSFTSWADKYPYDEWLATQEVAA